MIIPGHLGSITACAVSAAGLVATGSVDKSIRLTNLVQLGAVYGILSGHKRAVRGLDFSPAGNILVSGYCAPPRIPCNPLGNPLGNPCTATHTTLLLILIHICLVCRTSATILQHSIHKTFEQLYALLLPRVSCMN